MALTYSECVAWRQYYDTVGYPDIASLYATHSCGNKIVGAIAIVIVVAVLLYVGIKNKGKGINDED